MDPSQLNIATLMMAMSNNDPNSLANLFTNPDVLQAWARQQQQQQGGPAGLPGVPMPQALMNSMLPNLNQFQNMQYGRAPPPPMICRICNQESPNPIEFHENGKNFYICSGICMEKHNYSDYKKKIANGEAMPGLLPPAQIQEEMRRGIVAAAANSATYPAQHQQVAVSQNQNTHNNTNGYNQQPQQHAANGGAGGNSTVSTGTFFPPQLLNTNNNNSELHPQMKKNLMGTSAASSKSRRVKKAPQPVRRTAGHPYQMNKQQHQRVATPPSSNKLHSPSANYQQQAPPPHNYYQQQAPQKQQRQQQQQQHPAAPQQQQKRHPSAHHYQQQQQQQQQPQQNGNYGRTPPMAATALPQQSQSAASSKPVVKAPQFPPTNPPPPQPSAVGAHINRMIPVGFTSDREYCDKFVRPLISKFTSHEQFLFRKVIDEFLKPQAPISVKNNTATPVYTNGPVASMSTVSNNVYASEYNQQTNGGYQNKSSIIPPAPGPREQSLRASHWNPFMGGAQPAPTSNSELLNTNNAPENYTMQQHPLIPEITKDVPSHYPQLPLPNYNGSALTNGTTNGIAPAPTIGDPQANGHGVPTNGEQPAPNGTTQDANKGIQYKFHESYPPQKTDRHQTTTQFQLAVHKGAPADQVPGQMNGAEANGTSNGDGVNEHDLRGSDERLIKTEAKETDNTNDDQNLSEFMGTSGASYMMNGDDNSVVTNPAYKSPPASTEMDLSASSTTKENNRQESPFRANDTFSSPATTPTEKSTGASDDEEEEGDLVIDLSACK